MTLTDQQRISKTVQRLNYDPEEIEREQRRQRALTIRGELKHQIEDSLARRVRMQNLKDAA